MENCVQAEPGGGCLGVGESEISLPRRAKFFTWTGRGRGAAGAQTGRRLHELLKPVVHGRALNWAVGECANWH
jgi:hypothetical protein